MPYSPVLWNFEAVCPTPYPVSCGFLLTKCLPNSALRQSPSVEAVRNTTPTQLFPAQGGAALETAGSQTCHCHSSEMASI